MMVLYSIKNKQLLTKQISIIYYDTHVQGSSLFNFGNLYGPVYMEGG